MSGRLVIGIDEAGYGPSMGPLVLGATAWWIPERIELDSVWDILAPHILPKPAFPRLKHIPIGDSKLLLKGTYGWANLSLGAEWMFSQMLPINASICELIKLLIPQDSERLTNVDWYRSLCSLQTSSLGSRFNYFSDSSDTRFGPTARRSMLQEIVPELSYVLSNTGIRFLSARARVIDEPEFNKQVDALGNKSTLLSRLSLDLAKSVLKQCLESEVQPASNVELYFDKHGGRSKYQGLLMDCFDQDWFNILEESPSISRYSGNWGNIAIATQFMAKGDSLLPSASASVIAKWLREAFMASLNDFWQIHHQVPLTATAGYYVDAMRFSKDIEQTAQRLNLPKELWWRVK